MKKMLFITLLLTTIMACKNRLDVCNIDVFGVKQGQAVTISSIRIRLDSVQDSRCAEGVECVWAGEAVAKMTFTRGGEKVSKSLKITGLSRNPKPDTVVVFDTKVILLNVLPYPIASMPISQKDYIVFMKLE
jgi:hypothetical protein